MNKPPIFYYPNVDKAHQTKIELEYVVFLTEKKY